MKYIFIYFIKFYQYFISPMLGANCRFSPTCSEYALQAITRHGILKGVWLAIFRVARCQPFANAGDDPVPDMQKSKK